MQKIKNLRNKPKKDLDTKNLEDDDEIKQKLKYYKDKEDKYGPTSKDYESNKDRYKLKEKDNDNDTTLIKGKKKIDQETKKPTEKLKDKTKEKERPNISAKKERIKRPNKSEEKRDVNKKLKDMFNNIPILVCCNCGKKDKSLSNFCETYDGPVCSRCTNDHLKRNPKHKYNLKRMKILEKKPNREESVPKKESPIDKDKEDKNKEKPKIKGKKQEKSNFIQNKLLLAFYAIIKYQ